MDKQPCVYILASDRMGTLYIGVTSDLLLRLHQHRMGQIEGFSKRYAVHRLVRFEMFGDMESAIAREKQLKRWHRPWKISLIQSDNPDWVDLAPGLGLASLTATKTENGSCNEFRMTKKGDLLIQSDLIASPSRHAELVSASMVPHSKVVRETKCTLNRVRYDESETAS